MQQKIAQKKYFCTVSTAGVVGTKSALLIFVLHLVGRDDCRSLIEQSQFKEPQKKIKSIRDTSDNEFNVSTTPFM